jgi:endonuclease YncB( thermonuclease family)
MVRARSTVAAIAGFLAAVPAAAQSASPWFPIPQNAIYLTGDSWSASGTTYRLYGVQACLRGTSFTNAHGLKRDCGEASLAMLVALARDLNPQCYDAAESKERRTVFVFCLATPTKGAATGSRIDLGTALISTGFAFAALEPNGKPVHAPYFVAQLVAKRAKAGFWAFEDVPDPNAIILRALRNQSAGVDPVAPPDAAKKR